MRMGAASSQLHAMGISLAYPLILLLSLALEPLARSERQVAEQ